MELPSEEALVARAKDGDRSAFDELLRLHRGRLEAWMRSRLGAKVRGKVEVEDLVQEAHLCALQSIGRFTWRGEESFFNWLRAIGEHLVWNISQKRSTGELRLSVAGANSAVTASRHLRREERFDRLEKALTMLKPEEREAVRLSRFEGQPIREIARRMEKTESAVKSLISRSLRKLKESFGDTESFHLPDRKLDFGEADGDG